MKKTALNSVLSVVISMSALGSVKALAGAADIEGVDGQMMKFEYRDDGYLRVNHGASENNYMIIRGNEAYSVTTQGDKPMVVSMRDMMDLLGQTVDNLIPDSASMASFISMDATGQYETLAGIKGEVYNVRYKDENGEEQSSTMVLTDDERAEDFSEAMFEMAKTMANIVGLNQEGSDQLASQLGKIDKGVLRWGDDMWVKTISDRTIDKSRFELPAAPMDMSSLSGLGNIFGGGSAPASEGGQEAESSGGIMEGVMSVFGEKTERQSDRLESKADDQVDRQTDKAVDSAIDKAFDKLFGN